MDDFSKLFFGGEKLRINNITSKKYEYYKKALVLLKVENQDVGLSISLEPADDPKTDNLIISNYSSAELFQFGMYFGRL